MRRDRVAGAALTAQAVSFGLNFSAGVFFAPASASYGLSAATPAIAAGIAIALTGLAQPLVGVLLDQVGARLILLTGLTLISSGYVALAAVQQAWQFVAAYVVLGGLGFAASSSLAVTTLIGHRYGDRAGPALARASVGVNVGQLLAPWAATLLLEPVGSAPSRCCARCTWSAPWRWCWRPPPPSRPSSSRWRCSSARPPSP